MDERAWFGYPMKPVRVTERILKQVSDRYDMERKYDGHRAVVTVSDDRVAFWTREKRPMSVPRAVLEAVAEMGMPPGTVLDGEIWSSTKRGGWSSSGEDPCKVVFWDAVRVGHRSLSEDPIEARRTELARLVGGGSALVSVVSVMDATPEVLEAVREEAETARKARNARSGYIHGVVLKRKGSPRRDRSTRCAEHADWMKILLPGMEGWEPSSLKVA